MLLPAFLLQLSDRTAISPRVPMEQTTARGHLGDQWALTPSVLLRAKRLSILICLHLRSPSIKFCFLWE